MYKYNSKQISRIFHDLIEKPVYQYPTQLSKTNFILKKFSMSTTKYSISYRRPKIWNDFFTNEEKQMQFHSVFLSKIKSKLRDAGNERKYFNIILFANLNN